MNRAQQNCSVLIMALIALGPKPHAVAAAAPVRLVVRSAPSVVLRVPLAVRSGLPGGNAGVSMSAVPTLKAALAPAPAVPPISIVPERSGPATLKDLLAEPRAFSLTSQQLENTGSEGARRAGTNMMDRVLGTRSLAADSADVSGGEPLDADLAGNAPSSGLGRSSQAPAHGRRSVPVVPLMAGAISGASLAGYLSAASLAIPVSPLALFGAAFLLLTAGLFVLIPMADVAQQDGNAKRQTAVIRSLYLVGLSAIFLLSAALTLAGYWKAMAVGAALALLYVSVLSPSFDANQGKR